MNKEKNECYDIVNNMERMGDEHLMASLLISLINKFPEIRRSIINYDIFDID